MSDVFEKHREKQHVPPAPGVEEAERWLDQVGAKSFFLFGVELRPFILTMRMNRYKHPLNIVI